MCRMPKPKAPQTPAPSPAPPQPAADVVQMDPMASENNVATRARRRGRNGLRIELGGVGGGSGLNIAN